jgi:hypothetical protein
MAATKTKKKVSNEKAVATRSLGMGGLGEFADAGEFAKSIAESDNGAVHGTATATDIKDAMGRVIPRLENVKVAHGGACLFQFPDGSQPKEMVGAVVAYTFHNTYFDKPFGQREEGERPPCFSNDGASVAERAEDPQSTSGCGGCERNRDATDRIAREHAFSIDRDDACNNYLSLALALPGREVPVVLQLSNTSFKPWAAYIQHIGTQGRFRPNEVATRLSLRNHAKGGSQYSIAVFEKVGALPKEIAVGLADQSAAYRSLLRREADKVDDAEVSEAVAQAQQEETESGPVAL